MVLLGGVGAWIAAQKHRTGTEGAALGCLLGPIGWLIEGLLPNAQAPANDLDLPILVEVYAGPTTEASAREFAADARDMLEEGYEPASQVWQGTSLTVTYRRIR